MREILFRGKRIANGEWVDGILLNLDEDSGYVFIVPFFRGASTMAVSRIVEYTSTYVNPETVGQFTGLTDKNGKKIFEGDIVNVWYEQRTLEQVDEFPKYKAVIEFGNPNHLYSWGWQLKMIDDMPFNPDILLWVDMEEAGAFIEVIGNIHDNDLGDFYGN